MGGRVISAFARIGPVRCLPAVIVLAPLVTLPGVAGCRPTAHHAYDGPALPASEVARFEFGPVRPPRACVLTADGSKVRGELYAVEVLPGRRELQVEATWSNRWQDRSCFVVEARAGRQYTVRMHESKTPQAAAGDVLGDVLFEPMGRTAAGALLLPGMLIDAATRKPPTGRPPWPCYLWISDNRTRQVVAGNAPK